MKNNLNLLLIATVILLLPVSSHPRQFTSSLSRGSALSVENDSDKLVSPNRVFTCGFILVGANAYTFSIWFTNSADKTKVWTAKWGLIVNGKGSLLTFRKDGGVVLTDIDGAIVWSTNTTSSQANQMKLLDSGNLVVTDSENTVIWQSFDYPTDTLLPGQPITKNIKLLSSKNNGSIYSGYYSLYFDNDNILRMLYDGPDVSSIYWPNPDADNVWENGRTVYNSSRYGVLDEFGQFTASDMFSFEASDKGLGIIRRLTLDSDGNLRLYSLNSSSGTWLVTWIAFERLCHVHGLCRKNGLCLYTQSRVTCSCPPNYEVSNQSDWNQGCKPKFKINCHEPNSTTFVQLPHSVFWGYDLDFVNNNVSLHYCKNLCKSECTCQAIQYINGIGRCYTKIALFNGKTSISMKGSIYFKVPKNARMSRGYELEALHLICNNISEVDNVGSTHLYTKIGSKIKWVNFYGFVAAFGLIEILFGILGWCFVYKRGINASLAEQGYELMGRQFRKFTFKELRKATQNFKEVIGMGGSGTVYKGKLEDERAIAVKKLKDVIQGEEEFWAEVSAIGRIYHMNLVKLLGFCFDRSHRLLVSEYVENGLLDNHLFIGDTPAKVLGWKERFKIALGTARGLAYLHEECLEWVIHCDVKPENILLGSDFEPKIADCGLAKLFKRGAIGSRISHIRGIRGYMAPEWASNLPITSKIDVFGYGVVLLEIVKGKRISDWTVEGENQSYEDMRMMVRMLNEKHEIQESWVCYFVDPNLGAEFDQKQAKAMVEIALSCVEEDRNRRPSMNSIVEFLLTHES